MKRLFLIVAGVAALSACAGTPKSALVEAGYPTGSLAVAAIDRGDWATAERLLTQNPTVDRNDPARLLNLGRVYIETGRPAQAMTAWRTALASDPVEVETLGGRMARSDELAREALAYYESATRSD